MFYVYILKSKNKSDKQFGVGVYIYI